MAKADRPTEGTTESEAPETPSESVVGNIMADTRNKVGRDFEESGLKSAIAPGEAPVPMNREYFHNKEFVKADLTAFGRTHPLCTREELHTISDSAGMLNSQIIARSGEPIKGGMYLERVAEYFFGEAVSKLLEKRMKKGNLNQAETRTLLQMQEAALHRLKIIAGEERVRVNRVHDPKNKFIDPNFGIMPTEEDIASTASEVEAVHSDELPADVDTSEGLTDESERREEVEEVEDGESSDEDSSESEASSYQPSVPQGLGYSAPDENAAEKRAWDNIQEISNDKKNVDIANSLSLNEPNFTRPEEEQRYKHVQTQIRKIRKQMEHIKDPVLKQEAEEICQKWENALRISQERMRRQDEEAAHATTAAGPSPAHDQPEEEPARGDRDAEDGGESHNHEDAEVDEAEEGATADREREPAGASFAAVTPVVPPAAASEPRVADQPRPATEQHRPSTGASGTATTDQSQTTSAQSWLYYPVQAYQNLRYRWNFHRNKSWQRRRMPVDTSVQAIPFRSISAYKTIMGKRSARSFFLERYMKPFRKQPEPAAPVAAPVTPAPAAVQPAQNQAA